MRPVFKMAIRLLYMVMGAFSKSLLFSIVCLVEKKIHRFFWHEKSDPVKYNPRIFIGRKGNILDDFFILNICPLLQFHNLQRDYILKSWLYPSTVNVCKRGKGGLNVYDFLSFHFLSAVLSAVLSKDRQAECVQAMKAQTDRPRSQLFLMKSL